MASKTQLFAHIRLLETLDLLLLDWSALMELFEYRHVIVTCCSRYIRVLGD